MATGAFGGHHRGDPRNGAHESPNDMDRHNAEEYRRGGWDRDAEDDDTFVGHEVTVEDPRWRRSFHSLSLLSRTTCDMGSLPRTRQTHAAEANGTCQESRRGIASARRDTLQHPSGLARSLGRRALHDDRLRC